MNSTPQGFTRLVGVVIMAAASVMTFTLREAKQQREKTHWASGTGRRKWEGGVWLCSKLIFFHVGNAASPFWSANSCCLSRVVQEKVTERRPAWWGVTARTLGLNQLAAVTPLDRLKMGRFSLKTCNNNVCHISVRQICKRHISKHISWNLRETTKVKGFSFAAKRQMIVQTFCDVHSAPALIATFTSKTVWNASFALKQFKLQHPHCNCLTGSIHNKTKTLIVKSTLSNLQHTNWNSFKLQHPY